MSIITISRQSGAQGTEIGQKLAERLGYRFVGHEVIHEICLEYGVRQDEFEHIYEQAPGLLERYDRRNREIVKLIGRIVEGLARRDNTVIAGRDAFVTLREYGDVLNVRVSARRSSRVQRMQDVHDLQGKEARTLLDRLDSERSKYIGAFHGLDWADAGLYDLCVSTDKLGVEPAVELVLQALKALQDQPGSDRPLATDLDSNPILERAINEALSLLDATAQETGV